MNINDIMKKIQLTGYFKYELEDDASFKHLELTKEEFDFVTSECSIEEFADKNNIDLISLICEGKIDFIHYTYVSNEKSILEKGLLIGNSEYFCDLGFGIYAIEKNDNVGKDNLNVYFEGFQDDEALEVSGSYEGVYSKCIYGEEHENYIVIPKPIKKDALKTKKILIEEEFTHY